MKYDLYRNSFKVGDYQSKPENNSPLKKQTIRYNSAIQSQQLEIVSSNGSNDACPVISNKKENG